MVIGRDADGWRKRGSLSIAMRHWVRQIGVGAPSRRSGLAWVEAEDGDERNDAYANPLISTSAFASQYVIPISRSAVTAVVRWSRACSRLPVRR